jgi:hypothetical protein
VVKGVNNMMECCVCGNKKQDELHVVCSTYGAMSECFCAECIKSNKENYSSMLCYYSCAGTKMSDFNETYANHALEQLKMHGKTVEEFESDLRKKNDEMNEWIVKHEMSKEDL